MNRDTIATAVEIREAERDFADTAMFDAPARSAPPPIDDDVPVFYPPAPPQPSIDTDDIPICRPVATIDDELTGDGALLAAAEREAAEREDEAPVVTPPPCSPEQAAELEATIAARGRTVETGRVARSPPTPPPAARIEPTTPGRRFIQSLGLEMNVPGRDLSILYDDDEDDGPRYVSEVGRPPPGAATSR
jgi:hypothetical protein